MSRGVWELSTARLEQLLRCVSTGADTPVSRLELEDAGLTEPGAFSLVSLARPVATAAITSVLGERAHRPPPSLELVWTGPDPTHAVSRDTRQVVRNLFTTVDRSVMIAGFAFWNAAAIFEPLHARALERALQIEFFIHVDASGDRRAMTVDAFFHYSWPWTDIVPRVYQDVRTGQVDGDPSSMHAKCIVTDDTNVLITSANFTERAHADNVELGVLVRDQVFGKRAAAHWRSLVAAGLFHRSHTER